MCVTCPLPFLPPLVRDPQESPLFGPPYAHGCTREGAWMPSAAGRGSGKGRREGAAGTRECRPGLWFYTLPLPYGPGLHSHLRPILTRTVAIACQPPCRPKPARPGSDCTRSRQSSPGPRLNALPSGQAHTQNLPPAGSLGVQVSNRKPSPASAVEQSTDPVPLWLGVSDVLSAVPCAVGGGTGRPGLSASPSHHLGSVQLTSWLHAVLS